MKKLLTVLGLFVVLGFVFSGVGVASASDSCLIGPLDVSEPVAVVSYGDG